MANVKSNQLPKVIFVLSGKRKSGKDFLASQMHERFGKASTIILRLSSPLKLQYAKENGLDYEKLLDASAYKEKYREDMIRWGEEIRKSQPDYFCRHVIEQNPECWTKSVWIVSDARRTTDIVCLRERFGAAVRCVRISAKESTRKTRGWTFAKGVDDAESECGLDDFKEWDYEVFNDDTEDHINLFLNKVVSLIQ